MSTPVRRRLRLLRRGLAYGLAIVLVCMALVLGVASQVLPLAERHPDRIAAWLSEQAGQPVAFDQVKTRWTRRGPLLQLEGMRIGRGEAGVRVGQAEVLVSMYAGLLPGRSFTELRLRGLSLTLQRDDAGQWSVRGLPGQQAGGDPLATLEGLGELQIIGGRLRVVAPSLDWDITLPRIDLRLRVDGQRVRAGTRAWIRDGAAPLRITAELARDSGGGRIYLDSAPEDLGVWSPLLRHAGIAVDGGQGRLQGWVDVRDHRVVQVTSQVELRSLRLRGAPLAPAAEAPTLDFEQVQARMRWRQAADGWRFDAPRLRMSGDGRQQVLDGLTVAAGQRYALLAERIDAAPLLRLLALSDGVDAGLRRWLSQARPSAQIAQLSLAGTRGGPMRGSGRLSGVGFLPVGDAPGLEGLAGEFQSDGEGFALRLDPHAAMRFDWPRGFGVAHELGLDGQILGWREGAGWRVATPVLRVSGRDYGARVRGGLWFQGDGSRPWIDLAAELDDAPVPVAKGFWIRHSMPEAAVQWLDAALVGGRVRGGRALVSGDLDDWPFVERNGRFEATARIEDGQFKFQPDWPAMERVEADIAFVGNGFTIGGQARLAGVRLDRFDAGIADFGDADLSVDARAAGDAGAFIDLLRRSPLQRRYGEVLDNLQGKGPVRASFALLQPLKKEHAALHRLKGEVELQGAALTEKRWDLAFAQMHGKARYGDGGFASGPLRVVHQGRPGVLSLRAGDGVRDAAQAFEADLSAMLDARELLDRAPEMAWLKPHIHGQSEWTVAVAIPIEKAGAPAVLPSRLQLRSSLVGTTLDLPAPLDKPAATPLATTVVAPLPLGGGQIDVGFGNRLALRAHSRNGQTGVRVALGSARVDQLPPANGLIATGRTGTLDAMEWIALARGGAGDGGLPLRRIDVSADRLRLLGGQFPSTRVQIAPADQALAVSLDGPALSGSLLVPDARHAAIAGQLARLHWRAVPATGATVAATATATAEAGATPVASASPASLADDLDPAQIPPLTLDIDDLRFGDAVLGSARLRTQAVAGGMKVEQLQLRSQRQRIDVEGSWTGRGAAARTRLGAAIDSDDVGALLASLGYPGRVGGGHGQVNLDLQWPGNPAAFRLATLEGAARLDVRDGHLLEVEPGAGRMLGLLSVAEVRRRLMLDFSDFFSRGFAFNRIEGNLSVDGGMARSDDLKIDGPAAEIRIRGTTDLGGERFDQTIEVLPKSANVLTAVGAVAGGPIGAAVGAVANAVLKKPLGEMGARTYRVTGTWKEPKVETIGREQSRAVPPPEAGTVEAR